MTSLPSRVVRVGALRVLAMAVGIAASLFLARWLGASEFGRYAFALSISSLVTLPFVQGLPVLAVREVSCASVAEAPIVIARMHGFCFMLIAALAALATAVYFLLWLNGFAWASGGNRSLWLWVSAAAVPLLGMYGLVLGAMLRGLGRDVAGHLGDLVVRPSAFLLLIVVLWFSSAEANASTAMFANAAAAALGVFSSVRLLTPGLAHFRRLLGSWLTSLWPLSTVAGMQVINGEIGIVLVGLYRDEAEVGYYKIATTLALQTSFLLTVVNAVAAPRFAAAYRAGNVNAVRALNRRAGASAMAFGVLVFAAYAIFGCWAISLALGPDFIAAMLPLLVLSGAHVATLFAGSTNVLLSMIGRERIVLRAATLSLATNVVLNLALIPDWGMTGAAVGTGISLAVWRLYLSRQLARVLADAGSQQ